MSELRQVLERLLEGRDLSEAEAGDLLRALTDAAVGPAMSAPGAGEKLAAIGAPQYRPSGVASTSLPIMAYQEKVPMEQGYLISGYSCA